MSDLNFPGLGYLWEMQTIYSTSSDGTVSVCHPDGGCKYTVNRKVFTIIGVIKNEKGEGNCDGSDQAQCYYMKAITSSQARIFYNQSVFFAHILANTESV